MSRRCLLAASLVLGAAASYGAGAKKSFWSTIVSPAFTSADNSWADSLLAVMSTEQKIAQLMVFSHDNMPVSREIMARYGAGGFCGSALEQPSAISIAAQKSAIQPFFVTDAFDDKIYGQYGIVPQDLNYFGDKTALRSIITIVTDAQRQAGYNFLYGPYINTRALFPQELDFTKKTIDAYHDIARESGILCAAGIFPYTKVSAKQFDASDSTYTEFRRQIESGAQAVMMSSHFFAQKAAGNFEPDVLDLHAATNMLRRKMDFDGLILSYIPDSLSGYSAALAVEGIAGGCNMVLNVADPDAAIKAVAEAVAAGRITERTLNSLCHQVLLAKTWMHASMISHIPSTAYTDSPAGVGKRIARETVTVLKNADSCLPFVLTDKTPLASLHFGTVNVAHFNKMLSQYADFDHIESPGELGIDEAAILIAKLSRYNNICINIDGPIGAGQAGLLAAIYEMLGRQSKICLVLWGKDADINSLDTSKIHSVVLCPETTQIYQEELAQVLFGALPAKGSLPFRYGSFAAGTGIHYLSNGRLRYTVPEEAGMDSRILAEIDNIANNAIAKRATPGCQVLVARGGAVVYEKSFGYQTYDKTVPVQNNHIYDIASITKVAATTTVLMYLEDRDLFRTERRLQDYLPYLETCDKGPLFMSDILTHQARLHPWIPFYLTLIEGYDDPNIRVSSTHLSKEHSVRAGNNFFLRTGYRYRPDLICDTQDSLYSIEVAKGLYLNKWYVDSIYCRIERSTMKEKKTYLYSDLGFIYLRKLIEKQTGTPLDRFTDSVFYGPLGAHRLGYLPLRRYPDSIIVPTEYDEAFRHQLLRGYVHDPAAAMLGGVSGHAGIFANANDLAKLAQMYLNNGTYGGKRYIAAGTIEKYTSCPNCKTGNRRGYGWDKPAADPTQSGVCAQVSARSYGHTGFTGTIMWIDPEYDLVYIFLSNRVCPDSDSKILGRLNVRPNIQKTIYNAINSSCSIIAPVTD